MWRRDLRRHLIDRCCFGIARALYPDLPVTYSDAIQFLYGLQLFGANLGLTTTRQLAAAAGNPDHGLRFIHVAGTNGKGSTCAMLEAIYRAAGLRVGLYISPHLVSFRERIQVNRALISETDVVRLVGAAREWIARLPQDVHPTFFEVITVIATKFMAEQRCDVVIWETGLGGRLDATTVVTPLASVITNIDFDHEKWLGDTIEQIAAEKAGIIKPGVPVVTAAQREAALEVIRRTALAQGSPLHVVTQADIEVAPASGLVGPHQRLNAALAVKVVDVLGGVVPVSTAALAEGLRTVSWPGRFQKLARGGRTIFLDGAHNPAGAQALAETIRQELRGEPLTLVLGLLTDKNWQEVCQILAPLADRIVTCRVSSPRSADPAQVAATCRIVNPQASVAEAESVAAAFAQGGADHLVVVTGSLYFVGEAMERLGLGTAAGERELNDYGGTVRGANPHFLR